MIVSEKQMAANDISGDVSSVLKRNISTDSHNSVVVAITPVGFAHQSPLLKEREREFELEISQKNSYLSR